MKYGPMLVRGVARAAIIAILLASAGPVSSQPRTGAPTLSELVEVRSIDSLVLSPDETRIAYRVVSRSVSTNRTTVEWYAARIDLAAPPVRMGKTADPIWIPMFDMIEDGSVAWTPDSDALLVREVSGSGIQVHQLAPGDIDLPLTSDPADVTNFTIAADGQTLRYTVHNAREDIANAQRATRARGVRIDGGVSFEGLPLTDNFRVGERVTTLRFDGHSSAVEAFGGVARVKTIALLSGQKARSGAPARSAGSASRLLNLGRATDRARTLPLGSGTVAVIDSGRAGRFDGGHRVQVTYQSAPLGSVACSEAFCRGLSQEVRALTVNEDTGEVVVLHEAESSGRTVIYGWAPGTGKRRTILDPGGSLDGGSDSSGASCAAARHYLLCVFAAAAEPPRLVRIDMTSGAMRTVAAPNAGLARMAFGETRFLRWTDARGIPTTGTLVLPRGRKGPLPLVITTNLCRGFLRGGASLIIPEHVLTQHGIAALCVNANHAVDLEAGVEDGSEPLLPHRIAVASYQKIIADLAAKGLIDPKKVGVAGHSFSANVVSYAVSHTNTFAAAVLGGAISIDPLEHILTTVTPDAPRAALWTSFLNLPDPNQDPRGIWKATSPALNADRITAPLLMELPESEYLSMAQLTGAINARGGAVDMIVFPGEGHWLGREPQHLFWRSQRALNWFRFWLKGEETGYGGLEADLEKWRAIGAGRRSPPSASGGK